MKSSFARSQKANVLKKVPLFADLNNAQLGEIAKHADEAHVKSGTVLTHQGKPGLEFVFILEGEARVEKEGQVINHMTAGDFFGEISLIDGSPRTASVITDTDSELLVIHKRSFDHLLDTVPELAKAMLRGLCQFLRRALAEENR